MASSSSSHVQQKLQVFISFRGEDTRHKFISHLYAELKRERIDTFIDNQLERGEEISPALLKAIEQSTISVIVLSENYAYSSWCLNELSKILECKKRNGQIVVPIFYHVNPSDIRNLRGTLAKAFAKHEERYNDSIDQVEKWKAALVEVANLSGWPYERYRPEAEFILDVVKDISVKLNRLSPVDCSNCHTTLEQPPRAQSILCPICHTTTHVIDPRSTPPPPPYTASSHHYPPVPPAPSPYDHTPPGPHPPLHGSKRAVICAVLYKHTRHELKGSINVAKCINYLLLKRFKFPESSIITLSEEETDPYRIPTKHNMRMALYWLVQGCQPGDSLVFYFSGHGTQQRNYTGDEVDGYDETLCPTDFETQGMIVDDDINAIIVRPLPRGVKLHAIIDACHSGTVLDLPFLCRMDRNGRYVWEDHRPRSGMWKGTNGGEVICFSGCDDDQIAVDTSALSKITSTGAMTYSFLQAIERGHGTTYGSILNAMRSTIQNIGSESGRDGGLLTSLLTMLVTRSLSGGLRQEPQLTANEPFDVYSKPFSL